PHEMYKIYLQHLHYRHLMHYKIRHSELTFHAPPTPRFPSRYANIGEQDFVAKQLNTVKLTGHYRITFSQNEAHANVRLQHTERIHLLHGRKYHPKPSVLT